jgi:uncharacterized repeat protein (TIGR01451 family)
MRGNLITSALSRRPIRRLAVIAAAACALSLTPAAAGAATYRVEPGWSANDYATGFPFYEQGVGPVGLAFDGAANLLVSDARAGALYKIPPGGGDAGSHKVHDGYGIAAGLAWDKNGRLYMARRDHGDVIEINPANGDVVRTVVAGMPCPVGLATDPISGDLFVSNNFCGGGAIMRITGFGSGPGVARPYAGSQDADGITFAPDGTIYAAAEDSILRIDGTNTTTPGKVSQLARVTNSDGIAYAPATPTDDEYLVVNRTTGEIDRVDFDGRVNPVVTGTTRGDLVTVGPDHCIYAALQDRVLKLGPATGACFFSPPPQPGIGAQGVLGERSAGRTVDTAIKAKAPKSVKRGSRFTLTLTVSNRSGVTSHAVTVTDTLPRGTKFVRARARSSVKGVACKTRKRTVTCRKSSLAKRKWFAITILVRSRTGSSYTNSARVKSNDLDPAPGNNKAKSRTTAK